MYQINFYDINLKKWGEAKITAEEFDNLIIYPCIQTCAVYCVKLFMQK